MAFTLQSPKPQTAGPAEGTASSPTPGAAPPAGGIQSIKPAGGRVVRRAEKQSPASGETARSIKSHSAGQSTTARPRAALASRRVGFLVGLAAVIVMLFGGSAVGLYFALRPKQAAQVQKESPATEEKVAVTEARPVDEKEEPRSPKSAEATVSASVPADVPPAGAGGISLALLEQIKCATVFVRVEVANTGGSGSGFLIKTDGNTGYIVTNHHVITPPTAGGDVPRRLAPAQLAQRRITVVFQSGTPAEKSLKAEALASDDEADLAILQVKGEGELPKPINVHQDVNVVETMPLFSYGFPLGKLLSEVTTKSKGNPAITVSRASVSSLRRDDKGKLQYVQLDGDLNPGNSGGPVLDTQGRLAGVAVAGIRGTRIGLAVPRESLLQMIAGRVGRFVTEIKRSPDSMAEVQVRVSVIDPMKQIESVAFHHVRSEGEDKQPTAATRLKDAKEEKVQVTVDDGAASFQVPVTDGKPVKMLGQISYTYRDKRVVFTEPQPFEIDWRKPAVASRRPGPPSDPGVATAEARQFTPKNGMFTITMPAGARYVQRTQILSIGRHRIPVEAASSGQSDGSSFTAASLGIPAIVIREIPEPDRLDVFRDALVKQVNGKVIQGTDLKQLSINGKDYLIQTDTGLMRMQLYIFRGWVMYAIVQGATKEKVNSEETQAFFTSFKVREKSDVAAAPSPGSAPAPAATPPARADVPARDKLPPYGTKKLTEEHIQAILACLKDTNSYWRGQAVNHILEGDVVEKHRAAIASSLLDQLRESDLHIQVQSTRALAIWGTKDSVEPLIKFLDATSDQGARVAAVETLGKLKDERAIETIVEYLPNPFVRDKASWALKNFGAVAETKVAVALTHSNRDARREACNILKAIGTAKSLPALEMAKNDESKQVAQAAEDAIRVLMKRK
jgi:S1-C subfamily serine protease